LRGFVTAMACRGVVVERARRWWVVGTAFLWSDRKVELGDFADCHDGARKSRNSGCCAWVFEVLKLRYEAAGAHDRCAFFEVESALKHLLEAIIGVDMICVVCVCCCVSQEALRFAFSTRLVMRWRRRAKPAKLAEVES
jgi:hypothetical protein